MAAAALSVGNSVNPLAPTSRLVPGLSGYSAGHHVHHSPIHHSSPSVYPRYSKTLSPTNVITSQHNMHPMTTIDNLNSSGLLHQHHHQQQPFIYTNAAPTGFSAAVHGAYHGGNVPIYSHIAGHKDHAVTHGSSTYQYNSRHPNLIHSYPHGHHQSTHSYPHGHHSASHYSPYTRNMNNSTIYREYPTTSSKSRSVHQTVSSPHNFMIPSDVRYDVNHSIAMPSTTTTTPHGIQSHQNASYNMSKPQFTHPTMTYDKVTPSHVVKSHHQRRKMYESSSSSSVKMKLPPKQLKNKKGGCCS